MDASYVVRVQFRVEPTSPGVSVAPQEFETTLFRTADPPGNAGWLFFRDHCWHGEFNDPVHASRMLDDVLDVSVTEVSFSELRTDAAYLEALRAAVAENLDLFNSESVDEALSKYLGSSIHVVD